MRNIQFHRPDHFDYETCAVKAGIQCLLSPGFEQRDEGGRVELLQRHVLAAGQQGEGASFASLFDVDPRLCEFAGDVFLCAFGECVEAHLLSGEAASHKGNNDRTRQRLAAVNHADVIAPSK